MIQPNLFGSDAYGTHLPKHIDSSPTSREAAEAIAPSVNALQRAVLAHIQSCGERGCTDEEGIDALALSPSTYRPRRIELVTLGMIRDSGQVRKTRSGRAAVVWIA